MNMRKLLIGVFLVALSVLAPLQVAAEEEYNPLIVMHGYQPPVKVGEEFQMKVTLWWQFKDEPSQPADNETATVFVTHPKPGDTCRLDNPITDSYGQITATCKSNTPGDFSIDFQVSKWRKGDGSAVVQVYDPNATPSPSPVVVTTPKPKATPKPTPTPTPSPSPTASPSATPVVTAPSATPVPPTVTETSSSNPLLPLLAVIAIAALGGASWYGWQLRHKTPVASGTQTIVVDESSSGELPHSEE